MFSERKPVVVVDLGPDLNSNNTTPDNVVLNPNADHDITNTDTVRFLPQHPIVVDLGPTLSDPEAAEDIVTLHFHAGPFKETDTVRFLAGFTPEQPKTSTYQRLKELLSRLPQVVSRSNKSKVYPINTDAIEYTDSDSELSIDELKESPERISQTLPEILENLGKIITVSDTVKDALDQDNTTTAENLNLVLSFLQRNELKSKVKVMSLLKEENIMQLIKIVSSLGEDQILIGQFKVLLSNNASSIHRLLSKLETFVNQNNPITADTIDNITEGLNRSPNFYSPAKSVVSPTSSKKRPASPTDRCETPTKSLR